ncbi:MAG: hypothetical protein ACRDOO_17445 [Actinomadura sp.]
MDDTRDSEHRPVYHADNLHTSPEYTQVLRKHWGGNPPRLFVLIQEWDDEDDEDQVEQEVVAYGIAMPNGSATTVGTGGGIGSFSSPTAASEMFCSDLVWLTTLN